MLDSDPEASRQVLQTLLGRYGDSSDPREQVIAEAVRRLLAELEEAAEQT
jgi:hypothetical protein